MKSLILLMVFLCLIISSAQVQAQTWSAAEKEVLQAIEDCFRAYKEKNPEAYMACVHDDFVGFLYGSPVTRTKADERKRILLDFSDNDLIEWWINPIAIRIVGDVAVIHHHMAELARNKEGEEKGSRYRWTDIMVKQNGKWVWIADHGGLDPGVKPSRESEN